MTKHQARSRQPFTKLGKPALTSANKHKGKTSKINAEKFRNTLDGSFEQLRQADAARKMNPSSAKFPAKKVQKLPVVGKADIDMSIDMLTNMMAKKD